MGTKNNPGDYDCYANALPDEPMFIILGRDPDFSRLVNEWAQRRTADIQCGLRPQSDWHMVFEAQTSAAAGAKWRKENDGKWLASPTRTLPDSVDPAGVRAEDGT